MYAACKNSQEVVEAQVCAVKGIGVSIETIFGDD